MPAGITPPNLPENKTAPALMQRSHDQLIDQLIVRFKSPALHYSAQRLNRDEDLKGRRVTVGHDLSPSSLAQLSDSVGLQLEHVREMSDAAHVLKLPHALPIAQANEIAQRLALLPEVDYATPDHYYFSQATIPNDPLFAQQWHFAAPTSEHWGINMPAAWDISNGAPGLVVAVLDGGILADHPDLADRLVSGYDFVSEASLAADGDGRDADPRDPGDACVIQGRLYPSSWHGTHVAGIIGAIGNNGQGGSGINWTSKIQAVRVLGRCGGGRMSDILDGLRWAGGIGVPGVPDNATPARVINLSLGSPIVETCGGVFQSAINALNAKNVVVVAAAGNDAIDSKWIQPANCNGVITVAASNKAGNLSFFSNWGDGIVVTAPGGEPGAAVLSTGNDGQFIPGDHSYIGIAGTSQAAPHVSGVVSLMLSVNPGLSAAQVSQILKKSARRFSASETCGVLLGGGGTLDAAAAIALAKAENTGSKMYLSAVLNNIENAEGPPPVRERLASPKANGFANGGFECRGGNWTYYSRHNEYHLWALGSSDSLLAHGGGWFVWLGGPVNEITAVGQDLTVSSDKPNLVFWSVVGTRETNCDNDSATVRVNRGTQSDIVFTMGLCEASKSNGVWQRKSVSLAAFAGQTVNIEFRATTNGALPSSWFLDDIEMTTDP